MRTLEVVTGAQYGSEAKGHVTHRLVQRALSHHPSESGHQRTHSSWANHHQIAVVRVAGPNAGHTVYDKRGQKFALRQVPVAAVEKGVVCVIAAGSEIDPAVLLMEIDQLAEAGHNLVDRLIVDPEATLITDDHKQMEGGDEGADLIRRIGSTGKGIGAARAHRLMRGAKRVQDDEMLIDSLADRGINVGDTGSWLSNDHTLQHIIIEGTQGYGLGLHSGLYPQVTSSDCRAIDFMAMAGIAPWGFDRINIWLVARCFPIRVAGNSGPLEGETSWDALGLEPEFTTVTKKMRRVGQWDPDLIRRAVLANGGSAKPGYVAIALTMVDQKVPGIAGADTSIGQDWDDVVKVGQLIQAVEKDAGAPVRLVTTGPRSGWFL